MKLNQELSVKLTAVQSEIAKIKKEHDKLLVFSQKSEYLSKQNFDYGTSIQGSTKELFEKIKHLEQENNYYKQKAF